MTMLELLPLPIDREQTNTVPSPETLEKLQSIERVARYLIDLARFQHETPELTSAPHLPRFSDNGEWAQARWGSQGKTSRPTNVLGVNFSKDAFTVALRSPSSRYSLIRDQLHGIDRLYPAIGARDYPLDEHIDEFKAQLDTSIQQFGIPLPQSVGQVA